MSTHKHIDRICVGAVFLALVIMLLYANGEKLGIVPVSAEENEGFFSAVDLDGAWDPSGATEIRLNGDGGKVSGNGAYISGGDVYIVYAGDYVISGTLTDGAVIINADGDDRIRILLNDTRLFCEDGAAIRVEQADKVVLTLAEGTQNTVACGSQFTESAENSGVDGAIYARDDLTINGSGALTVTGEYCHGIVCNDDLVITGGTITVEARQDGIHANDSVCLANSDVTIHAGDDGVTASNDDSTSFFYMESGSLTIPACYEGVEAINVLIAGGTVNITPEDDGINANGSASNSAISITGGDITVINPTGRDADGLDSNGSIFISGGKLFVSVADNSGSCALDYGSESGGVLEIAGGTVIACGSGSMQERISDSSTQTFLVYNGSTAPAETELRLTASDGTILVSETIPCGFSSVILSTPEMRLGDTCLLAIGDTAQQITLDNSSAASAGFGRGGKTGQMTGQTRPAFGENGNQAGMPDWQMSNHEQIPEEGQIPNDAKMPGNRQMPGDGQIPDNTMPSENMEIPEGFTPPQNTEQSDKTGLAGDTQFPGGDRVRPDDGGTGTFGKGEQGMRQEQETAPGSGEIGVSAQALLMVGLSVLVLAAGIIFAVKIKH